MTTKLGRTITFLKQLPLIKLLDSFVMSSWYVAWQTETIISPLLQWLSPPNLILWWLTLRGSYFYSHLSFWLHGLASSITTTPLANIFGKVVTYHRELAPTKFLHPPITWFCQFNEYFICITYSIKFFLSALELDQLPQNIATKWLVTVRSFHP